MTSSKAKIVAVLFDADGVVQRTKPGWIEELQRLSGDAEDVESFTQDVFKAEEPCLLGKSDFEASLSSVLKKWNSPATISEALNIWTMIDPDDSVLSLIRRLRANGTTVALATNQQEHRAEFMLSELGYAKEFDHILCSCFLGHAKPGLEYFNKSMDILDIPPDQMLFIDDHDRNVESAKIAGLHSHKFHLDDGLNALLAILERYGLAIG